MTDHRTHVRFQVEPRLVPPKKAARRLHLTHGEFMTALPALRRERFPAACNVTGHYDLKAIDAWLDMRSKLVTIGDQQTLSTSEIVKARLAKRRKDFESGKID